MERLVIWSTVSGLLIGALAGEWKGTTDVTSKSKETLRLCQNESTTQCDIVAATSQLSRFSENAARIQWRRGLIGACALTLAAPYLLAIKISSRQSLLLILLTWVILTAIAGFNDYHMRYAANAAINDCLLHEVNLLSQEGDVCSSIYIDTVTQSKLIR